jgi:hypothetical protein
MFSTQKYLLCYPTENAPETSKRTELKLNSKKLNMKRKNLWIERKKKLCRLYPQKTRKSPNFYMEAYRRNLEPRFLRWLFLSLKIVSPNGLSASCNNVDTNFDFERYSIPTSVCENQEAYSPVPQNYDQCCISSLKSYSESFRWSYQEMTEKNP